MGGNIRIWAENINVVEKDSLPLKEGKYVKIAIKDLGPGISKDHLLKIFDPYFTTKQGGHGLGLSIIYSIVKKHNGHITVESEIGVGTVFYIYLPASGKVIMKESVQRESKVFDNSAIDENDKGKPTVCRGKILVMDDEYAIRNILCKQLTSLKYEAETVREGLEAIRLYKSARESGIPFDVVILDLTISGGMGGKETIKRLIEIDTEIKAIVSSGYANDPIMTSYKEYGFCSVLAKPHEIHELDLVLQNLISGN